MIGSQKKAATRSAPTRSMSEQTLGVVPVDRLRVGHELSVAVVVCRDTGQRGTRDMHAVVGLGAADEQGLLRLADLGPVPSRQLGRGVDGIATAGGEEDLAAGYRCQRGEPVGEGVGDIGGEVTESGVMGQRRQLCAHGVGDLGATVTDVGEPQSRRGVEVGVALRIPDARPLTAGDDERTVGTHRTMSAKHATANQPWSP